MSLLQWQSHSKFVEAFFSAVKATVSLLQWQRQASSLTPLKQPLKRACYNKHFLQSTSQQACYKRLLKKHEQSPSTSSAYERTLIGLKADEWFIAAMRTSLVEEEEWCYDYAATSCFAKQLAPDCCSKLLCQATFPWLLQSWLGVRQQLLYTAQLSLLYLFFMLLVLVNLHPYDLSLCWFWHY